jgi:hypothetical protein
MWTLHGFGFSFALLLTLPVGAASSVDGEPRFVFGQSTCPTPKQVERDVLRLTPREQHHLLSQGVHVNLTDFGDTYRISIVKDGELAERDYSNPPLECERRARFAAVFIIMTVMPPALPPEEEPNPEGPPTESSPGEATRTPSPDPPATAVTPQAKEATESEEAALPEPALFSPVAGLSASALLEYAPATNDTPQLVSPGVELGARLGPGSLQGLLAVGLSPRAPFTIGGTKGDLMRIPAHAGLHARIAGERFALGVDAALRVTVQRIRGISAPNPPRQTVVDFGARGGISADLAFHPRASMLVALDASVSPRATTLSALPAGELGHLPYVWLGMRAGLILWL